MANLGPLALNFSTPAVQVANAPGYLAMTTLNPEVIGTRAMATWLEPTRYADIAQADAHGYFSGTVVVEAVPVPYAMVRLYYRPTGQQIGSMRASASGAFRFDGIPGAVADYFVLAFDPDGDLMYNLAAFDRIAAAPDHNKTSVVVGIIAGSVGSHTVTG